MNGERLAQIAMRIYFAGGEMLLRLWYVELNKDEQLEFDTYIEGIVGSLGFYYDPQNPEVKIMSQQMIDFWENIQTMFPEECTLAFHRHLVDRLYITRCPDCGTLLLTPKYKKFKFSFR